MSSRVALVPHVDPSFDQSSPFFVHLSDGPSSVKVQPPLTGANYHFVYVDDIILACDDLNEFSRIKNILDTNFKIKDLGVLKYFLGLEVAHSKQGISVSQRKILPRLIEGFRLIGIKVSYYTS
jgi:hypothetical protein